jgi:hypothetical protein
MKYRIKETVKTFEDGHQELVYNIQFKFLFWWKDLYYKIPKKIEYDTVSFEWYYDILTDCSYERQAKLCLGNITEARNVLNVLNDNKDIDIAMWKGSIIYYYSEDNFVSYNVDNVKEHIRKVKINKQETKYYID